MSGIDPTHLGSATALIHYRPSPAADRDPMYLVLQAGAGAHHSRYPFFDHVEIGRYQESRANESGALLVQDSTVSRRHCIITQSAEGRCVIRDVSRNGTWLDGRRLLPNVEVDLRLGHVVRVGDGYEFRVEGGTLSAHHVSGDDGERTQSLLEYGRVAILVGDIRNYTTLVQRTDPAQLQRSVDRVFQRLEDSLIQHGASIKEYQGDAIFAYWSEKTCGNALVAEACEAALHVDALARSLAGDTDVWDIPDAPLGMDWAIATGSVAIKSVGGPHPTGISMIGEPVVLAFRLEKLADEERGSVLVCPSTREEAADRFAFRDLGRMPIVGFDEAVNVYHLLGTTGEASRKTLQ